MSLRSTYHRILKVLIRLLREEIRAIGDTSFQKYTMHNSLMAQLGNFTKP